MIKTRFVNHLNGGNRLLLDGGLSNQLEQQGCDLNHELWSAKLLLDEPDAIVQAHLNYLQAGATILSGCCRVGPEHIKAIKESCDL
ncbi:MAG: hypothetical protein GY809_11865 [Planctomycetes bacterium]|nr:hypothetical protein [Planctomycetota bacterium]